MQRPEAGSGGAVGAIVAFLIALTSTPIAADQLPDLPVVTTFAGSGSVGVADGPGSSATFVAPTGIAYGSDGMLYVADRDAQRIRVVSPQGVVSTIAGGAPLVALGLGAGGSYRDGPALQAYFNMPSAVQPLEDGTVLVADTYNFCIRAIRKGIVTTFAGDRVAGNHDGPRAVARFAHPSSFALGVAGAIYVADPPNGVRRIDRNGSVTTLHFPGSESVVALAKANAAANADTLLVASTTLVQRLDARTLAVDRPYPLAFPFDVVAPSGFHVNREGLTYVGPAAAIAAFRDDDFAFVDPLSSAVRFGQTEPAGDQTLNYARVLTAIPPENASLGIAGFADGPGATARVDEPLGIALAPDGTLAIADTGNRRIRLLSRFDHHTHLSTEALGTELPAKPDKSEYRIAIVGNSYIWWNQAWHESIPGALDDRLQRAYRSGRRPHVYPIMRQGIPTLAALDYIDNELSVGTVDMVVLDVGTYGQAGGDGFAGTVYFSGWQHALAVALEHTRATLAAAHVPLLLVDFPGAADFPDEFAFARLAKGPHSDATGLQNQPTNVQYYRDEIARVLADSHVPTLDLWPAFVRAYGAPDRVPLFASWDHHLTAFGRDLIATSLADRLIESHPWSSNGAAAP